MPLFTKNATIAVLLVSGGLQACGYAGFAGRQSIAGELQSEMRDIRRLIEQEVGDASAERPEQCRVLPVGARACGGPQTYLIYSTAISDERKLQELARQYAESEQKYNRVTDTVSTCSYVMPPEVQLVNRKCTSRQHQAWQK